MRAILEFELPSQRTEYRDAIEGTQCRLVLWDLEQWFRNRVKYEIGPEEELPGLEAARKALHEFLEDHRIDIWEE